MLDDFIHLSEQLTGVSGLDRALASQYLARYLEHPVFGAVLSSLISTSRRLAAQPGDLDAAIRRHIMNDPDLGPAAQQLLYLWYVAAFFEVDSTDPASLQGTWIYGADPDPYGRGLMWAVVRAHAPMTPGGDAGYWSDPPDPRQPIAIPPSGWMDR